MSAPEKPRYPDIEVALAGQDGNAMSIIARVRRALIDHGVDAGEAGLFVNEAMSGDYDNVLATAMRWVQVS